MTGQILAGVIAALALVAPVAAGAETGGDYGDYGDVSGSDSNQLFPYLQCVPYARQVSGIRIYGDAHTWWDQAAGRYARGNVPQVGAVMAFRPHGNMRLGHVAAVSRVVDARTVLLRHSNWSPINGRRGQIEDDVRAIDVSQDNDWSEVRVWYDPLQALGGTHWPVEGFIYNSPTKRFDEGSVLARVRSRGSNEKVQLARSTASQARSADPIGEIIAARSRRGTLALRD